MSKVMIFNEWMDDMERYYDRMPSWYFIPTERRDAYKEYVDSKRKDNTVVETPIDTDEEREGEWMHTSLGGRFYPLDPRPEDIHISDIANGLALDCRYGGQGRVDRFYSVAEHSYHMSKYAEEVDRVDPLLALAVLLHDAPEAYINDLPRAPKHAVGYGYAALEGKIGDVIWQKYGVFGTSHNHAKYIKSLDCRIVPHEKEAIMRYPQPWAYDQFKPLDGIVIYCWEPALAKRMFLAQFDHLTQLLGREAEEWEI